MAEYSFQEVMRQLNRLCSHYQNCGEDGCPIFDECGNIGSHSSNKKQAMRIEKTVMSWAAENPEPVYPSYLEVFGWGHEKTWAEIKDILTSPIPADIAQKLGIEPKEG